jgi:hypothetical protein
MLSVQECKQYLRKGDFTDEQVEQLRDSLVDFLNNPT